MTQTLMTYEDALRLYYIARRLHALDEHDCNGYRTQRASTAAGNRTCKLMSAAHTIAQKYGLIAYHQSDPRGCPLYLVTKEDADTQLYTNGTAIVSVIEVRV